MKAAKATLAGIDPMADAQRAVDLAQSDESRLRGELATAERVAASAAERFLRDASTIEANMRATMLRDRAKALHLESEDALATAKATLAGIERKDLAARHEADRVALRNWRDALAPLHLQLVTLDSHLDDLVVTYARHVLDAQSAWDEAEGRAKTLGLRLDGLPRPTLEDAQLEASRAARLAREGADRDCLADWLAPELGAGKKSIDDRMPAAQRMAVLDGEARALSHGPSMIAAQVDINRRRLAATAAPETNDNTSTEGT